MHSATLRPGLVLPVAAVITSAPANADQYDFASALDNDGVLLREHQRVDRHREASVPHRQDLRDAAVGEHGGHEHHPQVMAFADGVRSDPAQVT